MKYLETLIREGLIGNSIETTEKFKVADDGHIIKAPLARDTLTVNPMEPRMMTMNAIHALKSLALEHPELKALLPQEVGETSEGAAKDVPAIQNPTFRKPLENTKMAEITLTQEAYQDLLKAQVKAELVGPPPPQKPEIKDDPAIKAMQDQLTALTDIIKI
jgi:hypothetical protein